MPPQAAGEIGTDIVGRLKAYRKAEKFVSEERTETRFRFGLMLIGGGENVVGANPVYQTSRMAE